MIDEDVLRGLFAEAADAAPPPGGLPDDLLAGLRHDAPVVTPPRFSLQVPRYQLVAAAVAVLVLLVGVASVAERSGRDGTSSETASLGDDSSSEAIEESSGAPVTTIAPGLMGDGGDEQLGYPTSGGGASSDADVSGDALGAGAIAPGAAIAPDAAVATAPDTALVIKTGSMTLEVEDGAYDDTVALVTTKVAGLGGYVAESTTSRSGDDPSGFLVVRVPSDQFDTVMADLRKLGTVVAEDSKGTDVGGAHADLEARLASLRTTKDQLETVRAEAVGVDQILLVQDRITAVQTQIEQLQGQLDGLGDQVAMASITLNLGEPGAERIEASGSDDDGLGGAWADARERFGDGVEGLVSWSGSAAVVLIVGLVLFGVGRLAWTRLRRYFI